MAPLAGNVGGVTALLTAGALATRLLLLRHKPKGNSDASPSDDKAIAPRFLGHISPAALNLLVQTRPLPFMAIQIHSTHDPPPISPDLAPQALHLTPEMCEAVLAGPPHTWRAQSLPLTGRPLEAGGPQRDDGHDDGDSTSYVPRYGELLCLVGRSRDALQRAACALAASGFHRVTITIIASPPHRDGHDSPQEAVSGGPRDSDGSSSPAGATSPSPHTHLAGLAVDLHYIGRDAVAVLAGRCQQPVAVPHLLLDVRRPDERLLYGALPGSCSVPVEQLAAALEMPEEQFFAVYGFVRPQPGLPIVLCSRAGGRATWAAQVCADAGLWPVYVFRPGVMGWLLDTGVKPYGPYRVGDPPPEPDVFQPQEPDADRGVVELEELGLLPSAMRMMHLDDELDD